MPRRKKSSGRARAATKENKLLLTLDKVNRKLYQLDVNQVYGKYSAKKMLALVSRESQISYKRDRRAKLSVNVKNLNSSQIRYYQKVLDSFLKSKTSSPIGIKEVRSKTEQKLKQSLGELLDKDITEEDVDDFYTLVQDEDFRYIADKIGDSLEYILVEQIRTADGTEENFVNLLSKFITVNTEELREKAKRLYNKYVK